VWAYFVYNLMIRVCNSNENTCLIVVGMVVLSELPMNMKLMRDGVKNLVNWVCICYDLVIWGELWGEA